MGRRDRGAPGIQRASASLNGLRAGRVPPPAKAAPHDRTTRATAPAPTSSQDRLAQERATPSDRTAAFATRAAMARRRVNAGLTGLRAGRVPPPAKAAHRDRTTEAGRARTSNRDRSVQGRATEIGPRAVFVTRAAVGRRRANVASTVPTQSLMALVEMNRHERGAPAIRRANANLIGLRAGRVPHPGRVGRRDLRTRAVARAQTSNQDRRAQGRVTAIGRTSPGGRPPPRKGPPKGASGPRRPPRKP
jgi:hypothetical protein